MTLGKGEGDHECEGHMAQYIKKQFYPTYLIYGSFLGLC